MVEDIEKQAKAGASLEETGKRLKELEQKVERLESRLEALRTELRSALSRLEARVEKPDTAIGARRAEATTGAAANAPTDMSARRKFPAKPLA